MRAAPDPSTYQPTVGGKQPENSVELLAAIRGASKRDAVDLLHQVVAGKSRSWCERNLTRVTAMDADALSHALGYADPTGNAVARNVDAGKTSLRREPTTNRRASWIHASRRTT